MSILLIYSKDFDSQALKFQLDGFGLVLHEFPLESSLAEADCPSGINTCVLVSKQQGITTLGERVETVRTLIGQDKPLIVCSPRVPDPDLLRRCGATEAVTPRKWTAGAVTERILAELAADGTIEPSSFGVLRGATARMHSLYKDIEVLALLAEPVLILGETGTGKELVAQELHRRSGRPGKMLSINCAALTPELLESELFGHQKGAFTGAAENRQGLLLIAGQGTVFLDEIGELSLNSQAKLLRMLDEKTVRPVGSNRWQPFEARIIMATNRNLEEEINNERYRRDLFERIAGFSLVLPPLRQRKADILLLAHHFVDEYNEEYGKSHHVPHDALDPLFGYDWPGNVRQLRQALRHAAAFAGSPDSGIDVYRLHESYQRRVSTTPPNSAEFDPTSETWQVVHNRIRERYFKALLDETGSNRAEAIRRSGLSRSRFYEILKEVNGDDEA